MLRRARNSAVGFFYMETLSGDAPSAKMRGGTVWIDDEAGSAVRVTISDVNQSNGVIHVADSVLVPR